MQQSSSMLVASLPGPVGAVSANAGTIDQTRVFRELATIDPLSVLCGGVGIAMRDGRPGCYGSS